MTAQTDEIPAELHCDRCGYDLRAHPESGNCPECGTAVAEAHKLANAPLRPAWHDSDPRWRRRILAGLWVLVCLFLMNVLFCSGRVTEIPFPDLFDFRGSIDSERLVWNPYIYKPILFSIGVVLLFAKERGRRRNRLDWIRPCGIIGSYIVFALNAALHLAIAAAVAKGSAQVFQTLAPGEQPALTPILALFGSTYYNRMLLRWDAANAVPAVIASITMLLACIPLFHALRASGLGRSARMIVLILALTTLVPVIQIINSLGFAGPKVDSLELHGTCFSSILNAIWFGLIWGVRSFSILPMSGRILVLIELVKAAIILSIAVWLTLSSIRGAESKFAHDS